MFSPERTPPLESTSDSEDDTDFPSINVKTPEKLAKLENEQTTPTKCSTLQGHVSSPVNTSATVCSSSTLPEVTSISAQSEMRAEIKCDLLRDKFKSTKPTSRITERSFSWLDELKNLSPLKVVRYNKETNESKKTARKVKKLTKTLREKSDLEKKASS